jgi:hypothetical protein
LRGRDARSIHYPDEGTYAWELLKKRIDYLNTFAGNRSEMIKFTKELEDAWARAGELALETISK